MADMTKHGEIRCNQRGVRLEAIDLVLKYGEFFEDREYLITQAARVFAVDECNQKIAILEVKRPTGWQKEVKRLKQIIQRFDKLEGQIVAVGFESGRIRIITTYHMNRRQIRTRIRRGNNHGYYS